MILASSDYENKKIKKTIMPHSVSQWRSCIVSPLTKRPNLLSARLSKPVYTRWFTPYKDD